MRRHDRQITDRAAIDEIVRSAKVLRLGLCDGGEPYVVPLSFGYDGRSIYLHCAPAGRKLDLMRANPRVCFEVDELVEVVEAPEACSWGVRYRSVIGTGRAVVVAEAPEKRRGLELVMAQYSKQPYTFPDAEVARTCVVRIDVDSMSGKQAGVGEARP